MKRRVVQQPAARRDVEDIGLYIARTSIPSARRFLQAARRTFAQLADHPGTGEHFECKSPALGGLRVCSVTRFRSYLVFYLTGDRSIEIIRVLHSARDAAGLLGDPGEPT